MRTLYFIVCLFVISFDSWAQDEHVAIMQPINQLFEGMNKSDSALVRKAFVQDATLVTIGVNNEGKPFFRRGDLGSFLKAMGTPHPEPYSEPIWDVKIEVDGNMAQVWARYAFYLGKNFHHCGVDAFQLYKGIDGWKIYHLADTRQTEGCDVPQAIKNQFK